MNKDVWDERANQRLFSYILRAATRGIYYAPDTTPQMMKRGENGPHSIHIAGILGRWARMWAQDMREAEQRRTGGFDLGVDENAQWHANMANADAEIERYLATFNLTLRAA